MSLIYTFEEDSLGQTLKLLAGNVQKRRLEKGISRASLSKMSNVPAATIAKFEQNHSISLSSFVALAKALGYGTEINALLSEPKYNTMEQLNTIKKNQARKRGGRNEENR